MEKVTEEQIKPVSHVPKMMDGVLNNAGLQQCSFSAGGLKEKSKGV